MNVKLIDFQEQYLSLRAETLAAITGVCDKQAFILGPAVESFEKKLAAYCGTKYAVGLSSGTDALLCALMAIDLQPGDEVICPSFTFFATAGAVARLGAKPVFVDIRPDTFNINAEKIEAKITKKTKAIIPVHLFGQCADMEAINAIAAKYNLAVIEDAAQAIGAKRNGKKACALSLCGCLSFYPTKNLGAIGDAGAICTDDAEFAQKCVKLRVHGSGHTYFHEYLGGNFRLAAIQAAVLEVKLPHLDSWHEARRRNASLYDQLLAGSGIRLPVIEKENWSIYNQYTIRLANRDVIKQALASKGIGSGVYYPLALHQQPCFKYLGVQEGELPETEKACREVLSLPIYPELKEEQIRYVAQELIAAVK
jgi:dTDP-4-amino-4,6-dideoxygalactose transaminase